MHFRSKFDLSSYLFFKLAAPLWGKLSFLESKLLSHFFEGNLKENSDSWILCYFGYFLLQFWGRFWLYFNLLFCFSFSIGTAGSKTVNEVTPSDVIDENPSESMSQISGFRRTLSTANSVSGPDQTPVPKFGVTTDKEPELAEVCTMKPYSF